MLVYGDHDRVVDARAFVEDLRARAARLGEAAAGLECHGAIVALFVDAAGLLQALADAEFDARGGVDEASDVQHGFANALIALADVVNRSAISGFADADMPDARLLDWLADAELPPSLTVRRCEGYAYYALYPELYLAAARALPAGCLVVGLRSIGTGLAALVASVCGARTVTLRPVGPPFARGLSVGPALAAAIAGHDSGPIVLVDEGPGLSGSSLGGAADWLENRGVGRDRILFMPSHGGDLGPQASAAHRMRWNASRRLVASFEEAVVNPPHGLPLSAWFRDLTGEPSELEDLSGGAWRAHSPHRDAPADPSREARKYRLTAARGRFLLKFIGLDEPARAKFGRARRLHEAGFSPEPLACSYGFTLERWIDADAPDFASDMTAHLARYLGVRAAAFGDAPPGASLERRVEMARYKIGQVAPDAAPLLAEWTPERLHRLEGRVRPVHVDARLHRWEWLATPDGLLKTDAMDHSEAHDLVGCQDIAWDVAGATVEFELTSDARDRLTRRVVGEDPAAGELVDCMTLCYLGFQIGWWTYAAGERAAAQRALYVAAVERMVLAKS